MINYKNIKETKMKTAEINKGKFENKKEVFNAIVGDAYTRSQSYLQAISGVLCEMMEVADNQGNYVSEIIDKALNNNRISDKQAWCVAFFAEKNGFIKA